MARALIALSLLASLCSALRVAPAAFPPHVAVAASRAARLPASRAGTPLLKEEERAGTSLLQKVKSMFQKKEENVDVAGTVGESMPMDEKAASTPKEGEGDVDVAGNVGKSMLAGEKTASMLQKVKDAGVAGAISYAAWELAFWGISVPVAAFGFYEVAGHWPDLSSSDDLTKLGTEAFAFVNVARFAVPLRIGLALSTTPWVQTNVVDKFINKKSE